MARIAGPARDLIDAPNFCHVATVGANGAPHVVPVWAMTDGEHLILNSASGRKWPTDLERDPRVACTITNQDDPYEYVEIVGRVVQMSLEDGDAIIDALARKYLGVDSYPYRKEGEQRVTIRIAPNRVRVKASRGSTRRSSDD